MNLEPLTEVNAENISQAMTKMTTSYSPICKKWIDDASYELERKLSIEEIRNIRIAFYADFHVSN